MVARRPPPLQLKYDNFRLFQAVVQSPAVVQQRKKSFMQNLYKANWRKVVIAVALLNAIRFFLSASNAFQDAIVDHVDHHVGLARMSLFISLLYIIVSLIEVLGVVCIFTHRLVLVRAYTYLAFASALIVVAAGIMGTIVFFGFSNEIVEECASLASQGKLHLRSTFQGKPWPITKLGATKAYKLCVAAWAHESSFQAISLFLCTLLPTVICLATVYTYYRQVTDPSHKACLLSTVPGTGRVEGGNRGNYTRIGMTSARQGAQAQTTTQRRRAVPTQAREAKGLQKQTRKCESFTTSQKKKLSHLSSSSTVVGMRETGATQQLQVSSVMKSTSSPFRLSPGPPSYGVERTVRPYEVYGPRMDADTARLD